MYPVMILNLSGIDYKIIPNNEPHTFEAWKLRVKYFGGMLLSEQGLNDWVFEYQELLSHNLARCCYKRKTIIVNTTCLYIVDYPTLEDIMLHEIAHALVGCEHGHDEIWRSKAIEIGCTGQIRKEVKELLKVGEDTYKIKLG